MTGTSRALRRLGVAGLSVVLATTGMAALTATAANAASVNSSATAVALTPDTDAATVNTCNPFTATVSPTPGATDNYTVTVVISQPATAATVFPAPPAQPTTIGFCDVSGFQPPAGTNPAAGPTSGNTCPAGPALSPPPPSAPTTLTCQGAFATPNGSGTVTFGVTSDSPGTMTVQSYVDKNGNGAFDSGIDPTDTSTKTWNANTAGSIKCDPASATNPAGSTHKFRCTVTTGANGAGTPVTGQNVRYFITGGPNAQPSGQAAKVCNEDLSNTTGSGAGQYGQYDCSYTSNGVTGTDQITVWVDQNNDGGIGSSEPQTQITKTWAAPAPNGSAVAVSCSPTVTTTGTAPNTSSVCQDPTSDKDVKFTATVVSGSPAQPTANILVQWRISSNATAADNPNTDSETLSANSCTTDSSGTCFVTLTDTVPSEGESITVEAKITRADGTTQTATGTKRWHNPKPDEARNIVVTPDNASQTAGGVQGFTALVSDRFGNPVPNVVVNWSETGPGALRTANTCTTGADGTCGIDATSLSSERGAETVTGTIATTNYPAGGRLECQSAAGFSTYDTSGAGPNNGGTGTNTTGGNNTAPGTTAGNCADNGSVTWSAPTPPQKTKIIAQLHCFSPHKHVLKCKLDVDPNRSGLLVKFKRRIHGHVRVIGSDFTNAHGKAHLTKRHLKRHKVWRVFAHVYATPRTTGYTTGTDRTRIK